MAELELKSSKYQRWAVISSVLLNLFFIWLVFFHKKQLQIIFKGTFMYVLLAYGLGILTFYLLWYKKPFKTIWEIAEQIIYEERKFFPSGYTLNKKDIEIEDLTTIGINVILFYFRTLPRTFIWDSSKSRVSGSVIKDINTIKDDLEKSNLANRHLSQRDASKMAEDKLRNLGVDINE